MIKISRSEAWRTDGGVESKSCYRRCFRHFHRQGYRHREGQRGVTLLEILVVLAIIGVLIAVSAPSFDRYLNAITFKTQIEAIGRDVTHMRMKALLERRILFFPQADERGETVYAGLSEPLPDGWEIEGQPIVFFDSGACAGGVLTVTAPSGRAARLSFDPPHCRFEIES